MEVAASDVVDGTIPAADVVVVGATTTLNGFAENTNQT